MQGIKLVLNISYIVPESMKYFRKQGGVIDGTYKTYYPPKQHK